MGKKFNKPEHKSKSNLINPQNIESKVVHKDLVKLSFKYLIKDNPSYLFNNRSTEYFCKLIERLSSVCSMAVSTLKYPTNKTLRNHYINWEDTTQNSFGLPNEDQLVERPFQFAISANEHGRVLGFFLEEVFFVVWLDPDHNTYS